MYLSAILNGFMIWINCTVHKRLQYSSSNCFSIFLDTPRALTSHDFIVRAIPSCMAFICLVIVAAVKTGNEHADYINIKFSHVL